MRTLLLRLLAILVAGGLLFGVIGTEVSNHNAIRDVQTERADRHTATCDALPFLTFRSTAVLRSYEQAIGCPLVGTVPHGGGQPVIPVNPAPTPPT